MVIKLDDWKISTAVTTPPALAHVFVTRVLTRDLLAVANLVACFLDEQRVLCNIR